MAKNNVNIDFSEDKVSDLDQYEKKETLVKLETGRRHVIQLGDIKTEKNKYAAKSIMKTNNLIKAPVKAIAIFANEYIPSHLDPNKEYIHYYLNVNGKTYDIVPINSVRNGTKIIKTSEYSLNSKYAEYINETIKSAYLTIEINAPSKNETIFIGNIKVLAGDKHV